MNSLASGYLVRILKDNFLFVWLEELERSRRETSFLKISVVSLQGTG